MARVITIDDTGTPEGVTRIADQLPDPEELQPGEIVTLRFRHAFVYLTGLVFLAAWRKALPASFAVAIDDSHAAIETQRFLSNTGFREVIETGTYHPSAPSRIENVYAEAQAMIGPVEAVSAPPSTTVSEPTAATTATEAVPKQPEEFSLRLSNYGTQLFTRELGTAIRADLASHLAAGRRVHVDLEGVEDITPSCVDEGFGKLSEVIGAESFSAKVTFEGGPPIARTLIQFVLKTRQRSRPTETA